MLVMNEMPIGAPYSLHLLSERPREGRKERVGRRRGGGGGRGGRGAGKRGSRVL